MRLLRLKITDHDGFRSLEEGFEIKFLQSKSRAADFNPFILTGLNGSGKSNVLEAIAEIFFHLDCIYLTLKPVDFDKNKKNPKGFNPKKSIVNAYELEYLTVLDKEQFGEVDSTENAHIKIVKKKNERPVINWENQIDFGWTKSLSQRQIKSLFPEYVVGYASGANETLSIPFFKSRFLQYDEYLSNLANQPSLKLKPESSLVFLDDTFSQAILLTNLLMQQDEYGIDKMLEPFQKHENLIDVEQFRLIIRLDQIVQVNIPEEEKKLKEFRLIKNLAPKIKQEDRIFSVISYIEKLKSCATTYSNWSSYDTYAPSDDKEEQFEGNEYLVLDYHVNQATKKAFQIHFEQEPLKLFELFRLLLILNNYVVSDKNKRRVYQSSNIFLSQDFSQLPLEEDRILRFKDFKIKKEGLQKTIFTRALSDGEHQLIHTLGLCLLFKNTRSLFLLDEPETHFNPNWKAHFISSIKNCFKKEKNRAQTMREVLITSHSPFLVSDSKTKHIRWFVKEGKQVIIKPIEFNTFGASIQYILKKLFNRNQIAELSLALIEDIESKVEDKDCDFSTIESLLNILGESVEKRLLENYIIQIKRARKIE